MATKTESKAKAFARELADLLERHEVFLHLGNGKLVVVHTPDQDETLLCQADEYGLGSVIGRRLRDAIAATDN